MHIVGTSKISTVLTSGRGVRWNSNAHALVPSRMRKMVRDCNTNERLKSSTGAARFALPARSRRLSLSADSFEGTICPSLTHVGWANRYQECFPGPWSLTTPLTEV